MITSISKSKIPSDYSYPLKTTQMKDIIEKANIITDVILVYWKPKIIGSIFEVYYWLPNENISYNRLYIRAGAILKKDLYRAIEGLEKEILPEFEKWIKNIEQLNTSSTQYKEHRFEGSLIDSTISIFQD